MIIYVVCCKIIIREVKLYAKENLKIDEIDNLMEVLKVNFNN